MTLIVASVTELPNLCDSLMPCYARVLPIVLDVGLKTMNNVRIIKCCQQKPLSHAAPQNNPTI